MMRMYIDIRHEDTEIMEELELANIIHWSYRDMVMNIICKKADISINEKLFDKYVEEYIEATSRLMLIKAQLEARYLPLHLYDMIVDPIKNMNTDVNFVSKRFIISLNENNVPVSVIDELHTKYGFEMLE